jgi:hypothetical protein
MAAQDLYYCVLGFYKGIFSKKFDGNAHIFYIPVSDSMCFCMILLGTIDSIEGTKYVAELVQALNPDDVLESIDMQKKEFENRFFIAEKIPCSSKQLSKSEWKINFPKKGKVISSPNLVIEYSAEFSDSQRVMFVLSGNIKLNFNEVIKDTTVLKMKADKLTAIMGGRGKYKNLGLSGEMDKFRSLSV